MGRRSFQKHALLRTVQICEHVDAAWDQVVLAVDSKRSDLDGERVGLTNVEHVGRKTCGAVVGKSSTATSVFPLSEFCLFSILKLLLTVPKMAKKPLLSNMKIWDKMAIFETTAKNSVLVRWVPGHPPPI